MKADVRNLTQNGDRMAVRSVLEMVGLRRPSVSVPSPISVTMAWCPVTAKCGVTTGNSGTLRKFEYGLRIVQICRLSSWC